MRRKNDELALLVKILHHLTRQFKEHAVLKGGMELALFSSQRRTNDLDFVFVPFSSKKDIVQDVKSSLEQLGPDTVVKSQITSKNVKFFVTYERIEVVVEINVAMEIPSIPVNTAVLAKAFDTPPQIIRVMKPEVALSHKIAAWNERRLIRDLYDTYYWFSVQNIFPDRAILKHRLDKVQSRLPSLSKVKSMNIQKLCDEMRNFCENLTQGAINQELAGLPTQERDQLDTVLKSQINRLIQHLLRDS